MITNRGFVNYLNDHNYSFIEVRDGKPARMACPDLVTVRLIPRMPNRRDNLLTVGNFGRKDNKIEVSYLGFQDLWDIDDVIRILEELGVKNQ